jgi:hypothetical protein
MVKTAVQWMGASPLWTELNAANDKTSLRQPTLLRFATDTFMQDLQAALDTDASTLAGFVAQPETWRAPAAGLNAGAAATLKLFQPVQARFYLVSASLACRVPGLPDHQVQTAQKEKTTFVLRRLTGATEYAWTEGVASGWTRVTAADSLNTGEEQLPMFPLQFGQNGSRRRLFGGLIPVGRRQAYSAARDLAPAQTNTPPADPRLDELDQEVIGPWTELAEFMEERPVVDPPTDPRFVQQSTAYTLIDFANYLNSYTQEVWQAIQGTSVSLLTGQQALYDALGPSLRQAMVFCKGKEGDLNAASQQDAPDLSGLAVLLTDPAVEALIEPKESVAGPPLLRTLVKNALPPAAPAPAPQTAQVPTNAQGDDLFIVRCVYERPLCRLRPLLSEPSRPFQMASFFDPDAPARPLQVALPVDTTPSALRRYKKNVAFLISDELKRQIKRVKGLKELQNNDLDSPGLDIGMICSFSIPIITICAFILLMIIVQLLNIVFWWLPFFKICLPVPTLKAK